MIGTNRQKKQLFVMAVRTPSGKTLPGNLSIIPSEQKWVFHALYQHAFPQLYSSEVCFRNRLALTVLSGRVSFGYSTLASEEKASEK